MKFRLLLLFLIPLLSFAQAKRSLATRKLFDQALEQYAAGNAEGALQLFEQCVIEDPAFSEAYLNISYITLEQQNYSKALDNARLAIKYNQFQSAVFVQAGKCFYSLEQYDSSAIYLKKGIAFGAKSETDYLYTARSLSNMEEHREATFYYSKALEVNSANAVCYNERGKSYFQLGEYELAKADFEKALALNPQSTAALSNMANVLLALGDNEGALEYIDKGIAAADDEQKVQLLILKGNYYKNTGDLENASASYNQAYELDQENAIVLNNQASILIELEDYQGAFEKCNQALELQPEMMEAYFNRGIANEMLRNVQDACLDWEQAFILGSEIAEEYLNSPICTE
ncbi:MAG: tetratricopeptide repeat protein [Bacteroidetes bacterium]|nr:tetratricopeptide repeat protein [Bacteroidota bacterium]